MSSSGRRRSNHTRWVRTGRSIGEGGQAHIYVVRDSTGALSGDYVQKVLKNPNRRGRIEQEIRTTLHAFQKGVSVLEIVDDHLRSEPEAERPWYVTPLANGGSLAEHIVTGQLYDDSLAGALDAYARIVGIVLSLHAEKIAHRDLKPPNILLHDDHTILADLGLCLALEETTGERMTEELERIGSLHYTPKEAFSRRTANEDQFAFNAYALGKILYDLLAGRTLPAFIPPNDPEYDLVALRGDPIYGSVNRVLRGLLHDEPTVRRAILADLPEQIRELRALATAATPAVNAPSWRNDMILASDQLARKIAGSARPAKPEPLAAEVEGIAQEIRDAWAASEEVRSVTAALGVSKGGAFVITGPQASNEARNLLGGLSPTKAAMEPAEDQGFPRRPDSEAGSALQVSAQDSTVVPFRSLWLITQVAAKDGHLHAFIGIVRRELGMRGTTDILSKRIRVLDGKPHEVGFALRVKQAAMEMLEVFAGEVVQEVKRSAK